jgi:hypothetical protein
MRAVGFPPARDRKDVLRFANPMRWVCLDDAGVHSIGENTCEQTDGPRGNTNTSTNDRFAA